MVVDKQNTVVYNSESPTAVVFFLHGLGDTAHGWAESFRSVAKAMPHVKFVLPTGKVPSVLWHGSFLIQCRCCCVLIYIAAPRPVTIANGREILAWVS